ncbi:peptidylprolyl isomerase [Burkholderiaceae bacterium DAT-1]|nr:peptidylprolyl isomerase [Burkholderiaceae bacterium DAT-1]
MINTSRLLTFLLGASLLAPVLAEPVTLDRIVAVVNKDVITDRQLDERMKLTYKRMAEQKITPPPVDVLKKQLLDSMVTEQVLIDYAGDTGLRVDDSEIDRYIEGQAEQNRMTAAQFRAAIDKEGLPFKAFRDDIRRQMVMARLMERDLKSRVFVSEQEVDQYLKMQGDKIDIQFRLSHIMVGIPEGASPDVVVARRKRADQALSELAAGKPFASVAAAYSESQDALSGGDLGWRAAGTIPPAFMEAIQSLQPGGFTPVLRSAGGFHIIRMLEKRADNGKEVVQMTHARHILIKVGELTSDAEAKARIEEIRAKIVAGAKFEDEARQKSEDISASKGGDLDWVPPGVFVPQFDKAMNELKLNEVSQAVRSPFGYHLIQVLGRKDQDVTDERKKERVRTELRERKASEQQEEWIQAKRDQAFVENRLDDK